jgi:RHS repeat-associated protein
VTRDELRVLESGVVRTNIYDKTNQLLSSSGTYSYSATYDAVGNRKTVNGGTYTVNNLNQYTQVINGTTNTLAYDVNGNLTNWNWVTYSHDSQSQLQYVGNYVAMSYDYRRLRVGESVLLDEYEDIWENISTMYDARGNLIERYDDSTYMDRQYAYADGIDEVVLLRSGDYYGQDIKAVVSDHLGSVVAYCSATGTKLVDGDYAPFGGPAVGSNNGVLGMLGFTGREYDQVTGLYYYRNRWYSPDLGRFLEPDPIGLAGRDVNLYRYVGNAPASSIDPSGTEVLTVTLVAGGIASAIYYIGQLAIAFSAANTRAQAAFAYMNAIQRVNAYYGGDVPFSVQCYFDQWRADLVTQFGQGILPFITGTPGTSLTGPVWEPRSSPPGVPPPTSPPIYRNPRTPVTPIWQPTRE